MKKIFLLTLLILITACDNNKDHEINPNGMLGPISYFSIRLVDAQGNWIEGIEEKEMKLYVADNQWNILLEQPENYDYSGIPFYLWGIEKIYNYIGNGKEEFVGGKKELLFIEIYSDFKKLSYYEITKDDTYGDYVVLKIDENTSLNIQLFYKEFYNFAGPCIEKFICNGKEYINLTSVPNYRYGKDGVKEQKTNDIVIE